MTTFDLGDIIRLGTEVVDASTGSLADGGTVICTVTLPDGTTSTPAVTRDSLGTYSAQYTPPTAGRYIETWTVTGTNSGSYSTVHNVWAADPRFIIGLDTARDAVNIPSTVTTDDEEMRLYLAAVTEVVEDICGPIISGTYTEQLTSGGNAVALLHYPVLTISSCISYSGTVATTWTNVATPNLATGYSYTLDPSSGVIRARSGAVFTGDVWVTYTAGRALTPPSVTTAATIIFRHVWQTQQMPAARSGFGGGGFTEMTGASGKGYLIPNQAAAFLKPHQQTGGFA